MSYRRSQSRWGSLIEAGANVLVGFLVAILVQHVLFSAFGIHASLLDQAGIAACFTVVSLVRAYLLRRLFEAIGAGRRSPASLRPRRYRLVAEGH